MEDKNSNNEPNIEGKIEEEKGWVDSISDVANSAVDYGYAAVNAVYDAASYAYNRVSAVGAPLYGVDKSTVDSAYKQIEDAMNSIYSAGETAYDAAKPYGETAYKYGKIIAPEVLKILALALSAKIAHSLSTRVFGNGIASIAATSSVMSGVEKSMEGHQAEFQQTQMKEINDTLQKVVSAEGATNKDLLQKATQVSFDKMKEYKKYKKAMKKKKD